MVRLLVSYGWRALQPTPAAVVIGQAIGVTNMMSTRLPLWLRFFLLLGVVVFAAGAGLLAYRYYTRPATLSLAVGSIDGEAAKAMSAIASELVSTSAPVRLKIIDSGTPLEAANAFSAGKVDLAVVRGDVGNPSPTIALRRGDREPPEFPEESGYRREDSRFTKLT
jgi:hypothetical protein